MNIVSVLIFLTVLISRGAFAGEQQVAAALQDRFFDSNGVQIRYVEQGQGSAVVLIHGYTGTLERHWLNPGVFANLANDYRVIAIDCRGHGKSGKPANSKSYGAEMGKDIIRLLDHLKIRRAHIVGFSMGAIIAGHLLTTNANRFLSATLVGHPAVRTWTAADEQEAEASARDLESDTPFRMLILGIWPPGEPPPSEEEIRKRSQALVAVNDPKALAAYYRSRRAFVVTNAQIARVRVPTLGIIGSADPSLTGMQDLKKAMPVLSLVIVEGAAHGGERGVLRHPQFLATLREFLAQERGDSKDRLAAEIIALECAALDRWITGDPQGYLDLYAPAVTYFDPTQERRVDGLEAMQTLLAPVKNLKGRIKDPRYEMIAPKLQRQGDMALLSFNLINYGKLPDQPETVLARWNATEVYARMNGKWKIIHSHWSFIKPEVRRPGS